jgi:hypothetical protein
MKKIFLVTILLISALLTVQAQNIDEPGGDVDVPVDGGLSLLVAAGTAYGVRRIRRKIK